MALHACVGCCCCLQVTKLHHDLEEAIHTNTQLLADSSARQVELKSKEDELTGLRVEILKVIKVRNCCTSLVCGSAALIPSLATPLSISLHAKQQGLAEAASWSEHDA